MKFRYKRIASDVDPVGYTLHPLIQVSLGYGNRAVDLRALIDSGATDRMFHRSIGEALGIDIESGTSKDYTGIARQSVIGHIHEIGLRVQGCRNGLRSKLPSSMPKSYHYWGRKVSSTVFRLYLSGIVEGSKSIRAHVIDCDVKE